MTTITEEITRTDPNNDCVFSKNTRLSDGKSVVLVITDGPIMGEKETKAFKLTVFEMGSGRIIVQQWDQLDACKYGRTLREWWGDGSNERADKKHEEIVALVKQNWEEINHP